ncbi:unnamed protein product [Bathycoccus prasinos]
MRIGTYRPYPSLLKRPKKIPPRSCSSELENPYAMFVTKLVFQDDITPYGLETHMPSLLELKQFDIEF